MTSTLLSLFPHPFAIAAFDLGGWLAGSEVRTTIANFFATLWATLANIVLGGLWGG